MGGGCPPPWGSSDQGSNQAVPLADGVGQDEPDIPLAVVAAGGVQDTLLLQVNHQSVNGALVAPGIQSQGAHQVGAGLGTVLDQGGADGGADQGGEHRSGCRWLTC